MPITEEILGTISCYDRVIINATIGTFGYAGGLTSFFYTKGYRIFYFAKVVETVTDNNRNYKGFNFFSKTVEKILTAVADGKFVLKGINNKELWKLIPEKSPGQMCAF